MKIAPSTRRRFLKQTFLFSAALGTRAGTGFSVASAADAAAPGDHHLLMLGDWGSGEPAQKAVAKGMQNYVKGKSLLPGGMLMLGDNFYDRFKGGLTCPRWQTEFEDMYPKEVFPGPCWTMLGNHDYDDEPIIKLDAELKYAAANPGTRWTMPAKWYRFEFPVVKPLVTFLVLDTNYHNRLVSLTADEKKEQLAWFKKELEKPRATPWLVVLGHHPLYSNGVHGDDKALIADFDALFREHKIPFYFCGHDHDLQHLEFEGHPTSFVISGGGGARIRAIEKHDRGPFGEGIYGFSHLQISEKRILLRHLDANAKELHSFQKTREGKMELLS